MDSSGTDSTSSVESSSSNDESSTSGSGGPANALPVERCGHRYGSISVDSSSAHLGDTFVTKNYYQVVPPPDNTLRAPDEPRSRRSSRSRERKRKWFVPRPSTSYFTGRRIQLQQLKSSLPLEIVSDVLKRKIVVVVGLGGSGKTQFCLKFAEENADQYWGVFWIDASNQETSELSWTEIGTAFSRGPSAAAGKFWLSQMRKPWLLILDNADNDDLDVTRLLPSGTNGHIIITTRRNSLQEYATAGTIRLDKMDPDEAINLLLNAAYSEEDLQRGGPQSRSIAQKIAEKLDYLAIALHQAGRTIRCKICTLEKYLSTYTGYRLVPPGTNTSSVEIITTWEIPFQRLENKADAAYQDAVAIFHLLAFMHHQPVHESIIQAAWSQAGRHLKPEIILPEILRWSAVDPSQLQSRLRHAFSVLYEHSVIEFDPNSGTCSVHPVIHEWARYRIREQGRTPYWLLCSLHVLACACSEIQKMPHEFTSNFLLPHIDSFLSYARQSDPKLLRTPFGAICAEIIASGYERAASWQKSLQLLETIIAYRSQKQGSNHHDTLRVKRNASLCYWNLFQLDQTLKLQREIWVARWWARRSLFDWSHPYRPQHVEYGIALSDLTQSLWLAGQLKLSKRTGERAVYILRKRLGNDAVCTIDATFNLARTYRHIGLLQQAHIMLIHVRKFRTKTLGLEHPDTLMVRNEVGMNLCSMKRHLELAEQILRNVLKSRDRVLGAEHAYTLWSVNDLSKVLCARERFDEAIHRLEDIIPAVSRTLGDQHVGMHMTKANLARALAYAERWSETEIVLKDLLNDENLGTIERIGCSRGLSRIQVRLHKLEEAEKTCDALLSYITTTKSAKDHIRAVNETAGLLRDIHLRQGRLDRAEKLLRMYPKLTTNVLEVHFDLP